MDNSTPWQLRMFQKTLKKRLRLKELSRILGSVSKDKECLLITCGDNNGAMNYYLREIGGNWSFADLEKKSIDEMSLLLNQEEKYGHIREGFSAKELDGLMINAKLNPTKKKTFSRFFTEMLELGINFLYVKVLSKKSKTKVEEGTIAPATEDQLKSVEKTYKLYSLVYPFFKVISSLDYLLFFTRGYVVIV